ncbi:UNVERIFIED_CONTAM: hypothetical protein FKN15_020565 [Acipenser sinensis]
MKCLREKGQGPRIDQYFLRICLHRAISTDLQKEDSEGLLLTTTDYEQDGTRNYFSSGDSFEEEEDDTENERDLSVPTDSLLGLDDDTVRDVTEDIAASGVVFSSCRL